MKKCLMVLGVVFGLLLTLSACAGESGPSTEIKVNFTDFMFEPVESTVPAGQEITITATNYGAVMHEYVIFNLGTDAGDKFDQEDENNIFWEIEVPSGETATETFTAPSEPGTYYVTCGIAGHMEAGMIGKLIVVAQ